MEKVDNTQDQMDNVSKEMVKCNKESNGDAQWKHIKKKANMLNSRLDTGKKRISEHEDRVYWSGQ